VVSFSVDLEGFILRLRVEAAPRVPRANKLRTEVGSGVCTKETSSIRTVPLIQA
jgi:hypothetical protein